MGTPLIQVVQGFSLSVDLGGTNLRICSVNLQGNTTYTARHTKVAIPRDLMIAKQGQDVFSFIASHVKTFLEVHHKERTNKSQHILPLGFCFAFPVYQTSIDAGILIRWTKGFDIQDVVGKEVCQLLQQELDLLHLPVKVTALVNDAVGTIMSRAYTLPVSKTRTSIGAIFGTGTNGVYLEQISKISKDIGEHDKSTGEMFLSTEWGSFDNKLSVLSKTRYDEEVDTASVNKGNQMFEKRVSGMFLGELLRIAVLAMHNDPKVALFSGLDSNDAVPLYKRWAVDASILSVAEADESRDLGILRNKVEESLGIPTAKLAATDVHAVKIVAHAIGKRAARLAGMAIAAVILQSGRLTKNVAPVLNDSEENEQNTGEVGIVDVGVDGTVVELYPRFEEYMREALRVIDGIGESGEKRIRMGIAKDGSSIGAAIVALLAAEQVKKSRIHEKNNQIVIGLDT
jgi:hexokinase